MLLDWRFDFHFRRLDDRPNERGDPAEHRPAEDQVDEEDHAAVLGIALARDDARQQIKNNGEKKSINAAKPMVANKNT